MPLTHDEVRKKICAGCFRKTKCVRPISQAAIVSSVQKFVYGKYDLENSNLPSGICDRCRKALIKQENAPVDELWPYEPDYENLKPPRPVTRGTDGLCDCSLCHLYQVSNLFAKKKIQNEKGNALVDHRDVTGWKTASASCSNSVEKTNRCESCFSIVGKGVPHNCTKNTKRENLAQLL